MYEPVYCRRDNRYDLTRPADRQPFPSPFPIGKGPCQKQSLLLARPLPSYVPIRERQKTSPYGICPPACACINEYGGQDGKASCPMPASPWGGRCLRSVSMASWQTACRRNGLRTYCNVRRNLFPPVLASCAPLLRPSCSGTAHG